MCFIAQQQQQKGRTKRFSNRGYISISQAILAVFLRTVMGSIVSRDLVMSNGYESVV